MNKDRFADMTQGRRRRCYREIDVDTGGIVLTTLASDDDDDEEEDDTSAGFGLPTLSYLPLPSCRSHKRDVITPTEIPNVEGDFKLFAEFPTSNSDDVISEQTDLAPLRAYSGYTNNDVKSSEMKREYFAQNSQQALDESHSPMECRNGDYADADHLTTSHTQTSRTVETVDGEEQASGTTDLTFHGVLDDSPTPSRERDNHSSLIHLKSTRHASANSYLHTQAYTTYDSLNGSHNSVPASISDQLDVKLKAERNDAVISSADEDVILSDGQCQRDSGPALHSSKHSSEANVCCDGQLSCVIGGESDRKQEMSVTSEDVDSRTGCSTAGVDAPTSTSTHLVNTALNIHEHGSTSNSTKMTECNIRKCSTEQQTKNSNLIHDSNTKDSSQSYISEHTFDTDHNNITSTLTPNHVTSIMDHNNVTSILGYNNATSFLETDNTTSILETDNATSFLETDNATSILETNNTTSILETNNATSILETNNATSILETDNANSEMDLNGVSPMVDPTNENQNSRFSRSPVLENTDVVVHTDPTHSSLDISQTSLENRDTEAEDAASKADKEIHPGRAYTSEPRGESPDNGTRMSIDDSEINVNHVKTVDDSRDIVHLGGSIIDNLDDFFIERSTHSAVMENAYRQIKGPNKPATIDLACGSKGIKLSHDLNNSRQSASYSPNVDLRSSIRLSDGKNRSFRPKSCSFTDNLTSSQTILLYPSIEFEEFSVNYSLQEPTRLDSDSFGSEPDVTQAKVDIGNKQKQLNIWPIGQQLDELSSVGQDFDACNVSHRLDARKTRESTSPIVSQSPETSLRHCSQLTSKNSHQRINSALSGKNAFPKILSELSFKRNDIFAGYFGRSERIERNRNTSIISRYIRHDNYVCPRVHPDVELFLTTIGLVNTTPGSEMGAYGNALINTSVCRLHGNSRGLNETLSNEITLEFRSTIKQHSSRSNFTDESGGDVITYCTCDERTRRYFPSRAIEERALYNSRSPSTPVPGDVKLRQRRSSPRPNSLYCKSTPFDPDTIEHEYFSEKVPVLKNSLEIDHHFSNTDTRMDTMPVTNRSSQACLCRGNPESSRLTTGNNSLPIRVTSPGCELDPCSNNMNAEQTFIGSIDSPERSAWLEVDNLNSQVSKELQGQSPGSNTLCKHQTILEGRLHRDLSSKKTSNVAALTGDLDIESQRHSGDGDKELFYNVKDSECEALLCSSNLNSHVPNEPSCIESHQQCKKHHSDSITHNTNVTHDWSIPIAEAEISPDSHGCCKLLSRAKLEGMDFLQTSLKHGQQIGHVTRYENDVCVSKTSECSSIDRQANQRDHILDVNVDTVLLTESILDQNVDLDLAETEKRRDKKDPSLDNVDRDVDGKKREECSMSRLTGKCCNKYTSPGEVQPKLDCIAEPGQTMHKSSSKQEYYKLDPEEIQRKPECLDRVSLASPNGNKWDLVGRADHHVQTRNEAKTSSDGKAAPDGHMSTNVNALGGGAVKRQTEHGTNNEEPSIMKSIDSLNAGGEGMQQFQESSHSTMAQKQEIGSNIDRSMREKTLSSMDFERSVRQYYCRPDNTIPNSSTTNHFEHASLDESASEARIDSVESESSGKTNKFRNSDDDCITAEHEGSRLVPLASSNVPCSVLRDAMLRQVRQEYVGGRNQYPSRARLPLFTRHWDSTTNDFFVENDVISNHQSDCIVDKTDGDQAYRSRRKPDQVTSINSSRIVTCGDDNVTPRNPIKHDEIDDGLRVNRVQERAEAENDKNSQYLRQVERTRTSTPDVINDVIDAEHRVTSNISWRSSDEIISGTNEEGLLTFRTEMIASNNHGVKLNYEAERHLDVNKMDSGEGMRSQTIERLGDMRESAIRPDRSSCIYQLVYTSDDKEYEEDDRPEEETALNRYVTEVTFDINPSGHHSDPCAGKESDSQAKQLSSNESIILDFKNSACRYTRSSLGKPAHPSIRKHVGKGWNISANVGNKQKRHITSSALNSQGKLPRYCGYDDTHERIHRAISNLQFNNFFTANELNKLDIHVLQEVLAQIQMKTQDVSGTLVDLLQVRYELREEVDMRRIAIEQLMRMQATQTPSY